MLYIATVLVGLLAAGFVVAEPIRPGENDECAKFCATKYPSTDATKSPAATACDQGCSLFSMLQFSAGVDDVNAVHKQCSDACEKAFANKDQLKQACSAGCAKQSPFTGGEMMISMDQSNPLFEYAQNIFTNSMDQMRGMQQRLMQRVRNMFGESGEDSGDGDLDDVFTRMQNRMLGAMRQFTSGDNVADVNKDQKNAPRRPPLKLGHEFDGPAVGNLDEFGEPILKVKMIPPGNNKHPSPPLPYDTGMDESDAHTQTWLSCLSRRANRLNAVTRWMLCVALFLCILAMVFICLTIFKTAPRRRLLAMRHPVATIDLKMPLDDVKYPIDTPRQPLVHNHPPPPYDEAGVLPTKNQIVIQA